MIGISELRARLKFWRQADRLGPDVPLTHWRLHFRSSALQICRKKFKHFHETAEFRPGAYAVFCSMISLGARVVIRPGCQLMADSFEGITIEDDVMLGAGVHIYVNNHRFSDPAIPIIDQGYFPSHPVVLEKGCWIGANTIVLPGVTIGRNAVVGAGSIVTRNIPARVVAVGSPARIVKEIGPGAGNAEG
jgi:acetyltransferase-like isoleucine patch superfamily enzyme